MAEAPRSRRVVRFGAFQCDLSTGELRRNGNRVYLALQPLQVLTMLLERPDELVTREEFKERLWPGQKSGTFEDGLNTAMNRLRAALNDNADKPRLIQTIQRRGYRFIAPVDIVVARNGSAPVTTDNGEGQGRGVAEESSRPAADVVDQRNRGGMLRHALQGLAAAAALFALWWYTPLPPPQITRIDQITVGARIDRPPKPVVDGGHIYYTARDGAHWNLMQTSLGGGDGQPVDFHIVGVNTRALDVSRRDSTLLLVTAKGRESQLWTVSPGAAPTRLGDVVNCGSAAFSPDAKAIACIRSKALWMMDSDGAQSRKVADLPEGSGWLAWSPDGQRLRFTVGQLLNNRETSIWEIASDGRNLHQVFPGWSHPASECCGSWTADGRYYVFTSSHSGRMNLWVTREHGSLWRRSPWGPFQLTSGPGGPFGGTPARDGRHIFFYNGTWQIDPQVLNLNTRELSSFRIGGVSIIPAFSRDGQWIAYCDPRGKGLFRSRPNGTTDRAQLAPAELTPEFPRWSPDGKWVAFVSSKFGQPSKVHVVPAEGGQPQELLPSSTSVRDADWSNDGKRLVVCHDLGPNDSGGSELLIVDFATRRADKLPASDNLEATRWSPDGRYISATNQTEFKLWSLASRQWRVIARGRAFGFGVWSPDSRYLYFQDIQGKGQAVFRYDVQRQQVDTIADFSEYLKSGVSRCGLAVELAPDGSPIIIFSRSFSDLFAAEVRWP